MINYIHQFFFKVKNKIRREKRKKNLINIPKQENNFKEIKKNLVFDPIIYTPEFIAKEAQKPEYNEELYNFLDKQFDEPYLEFVKKYYEKISQAHKTHSNYIDMIKILFVISKLIRPKNYLEVGVGEVDQCLLSQKTHLIVICMHLICGYKIIQESKIQDLKLLRMNLKN